MIALNLATAIGLSPIFAATQLRLGVALDRFGPKLCMPVSIGFTVLGCVLFALGTGSPDRSRRAMFRLATRSF
jgi:hypothetical protein